MISLTIEDSVATVTLCRAPVNAINEEWIEQFDRILAELETLRHVNVLRIRSGERLFCAGADLELIGSLFATEAGRVKMIAITRRMQEIYARLERLPQVTVAEINGAAMGGGFELALACDLRVVADSAKVGLPEARLGLLPAAGGTQRMTRICGEAVARRLILGAEVLAGADAVALGCAHWVVPAAELPAFVAALVARLAALPAKAIAECKHCIEVAVAGRADGYEVELAGSAALLADGETQERVRGFLNRQ
ncbi:enoyl-CoA hydratase/isomerase family protein [Aromatoleum toluvorans]|uniref:Enoyl-CoA hydratase/isomerase family protein n=1 Tax=Aromatoleum toluvorans TaxID=92002 RepID=A0ABX1Q1S1_9RHOO|nr:enoyl-CoA hydratase/isomerase family protein [Aromatoleum toluvorans]NMG45647.1 enoyl-CoA hydratase/isomerase family protein [Aromatoleum toluvorans]